MTSNRFGQFNRHSQKKAYYTVCLSNLQQTVNKEDIRNHFLNVDRTCRPKIAALVPALELGFQSTTVTFLTEPNRAHRRSQVEKLMNAPLIHSEQNVSRVIISDDWSGVRPLAQSHSEPSVDFYFVHGLGGHAYKTFHARSNDNKAGCMWPRDLLPESLALAGYFARYLTRKAKEKGEEATLPVVAEELLNDIADSRPRGCKRPIIFVCHSFGGLVVCQAVREIMEEERSRNCPSDFKDIFSSSTGGVIVKGIVSFGTPFKGSVLADIFGPSTSLFSSRLKRLKRKDEQRMSMLRRFEELRLRPEHNLPLLIFYEKKPVKRLFFQHLVVNRDAAIGIFADNVRRRAIDRDHRQICKFSSASDEIYSRRVAPIIRRFLEEKTSVERKTMLPAIVRPEENARAELMQDNHLHLAQNRVPAITDESNVQAGQVPPDNLRSQDMELGAFSTTTNTATATTVVNQLRVLDFSKNHKEVRQPLAGTCDWILQKDIFNRWCNDYHDSVLFIRAGQGLGKSVLSKFIAKHVSDTRHDNTVLVIPFYCKTASRQSNPESILRHVLCYLCQRFPAELSKLPHQQTQLLGSNLTFSFYWSLFLRISEVATFELLCIVDGLDECIADIKDEAERNINTVLVEFLEDLCQKFKGDYDERPGKVKVLFTTRPIKEVTQVTERFGGLVLDIWSSDLISGVEKMIDTDVHELVTAKNLSPEIEDLITVQLKSKAGPMYQWAHAVLRKLWGLTFNSNALESYRTTLERFRPDDIDNPYYETLRGIQDDTTITAADKDMIVNLLCILVFVEMDLDIQDLEYAIASVQLDVGSQGFRSCLPIALLNRIQASCGALPVVEDGMVRLAHQSVRDFFLHRGPDKLSVFSCKDVQLGHRFMACLCLKYLMLWHVMETPEIAPDATVEDRLNELVILPFVWYASNFWDYHIRRLENLKSLWACVQFLSDSDYANFEYMQLARRYHHSDYDYNGPKAVPSISVFLASEDLLGVLKHYKFVQDRRRLGGFGRLKSRKASKKDIWIDLAERDENDMTMLHWAAQNGSLDLVNMLLKHDPHGDVWNKDGETPFTIAVACNHEHFALASREKGQIYMEHYSDKRISTLQLTACHGMQSLLQYLLNQGTPVDDDTGRLGWTPLYVASEYCHHHIVKILLDRGANPNKRSRDGSTALHAAARKGSLPIVLELLRAPTVNAAAIDESGDTPLTVAASNGHYEVFKELIMRNPRVPPNTIGCLPIHYAAANGHTAIVRSCSQEDLSSQAKSLGTPLHFAAAKGHPKIVRYFLAQGVDINAKCHDQFAEKDAPQEHIESITPIMLAANCGHKEVVDVLLENGADLHGTFSHHRNLLHLAAARGHCKLFDRLLRLEFDPFARDIYGMTPWHGAAREGEDVNVNKYLQRFGGNEPFHVDMEDGSGLTAFLLATAKGSISTMEILKKAGADIYHYSPFHGSALSIASGLTEDGTLKKLIAWNVDDTVSDRFGNSPMHEAANSGIVANLEILAGRGKDVNAQSITGDTPLLHAAWRRREANVNCLLKFGANPTIRDGCGLAPLDYSIEGDPIRKQLQSKISNAGPMDEADRKLQVKTSIRKIFNHFDSLGELHPSLRWRDYLCLAHHFLRVPNNAATKILLETQLERLHDGRIASESSCSECEKTLLERPLHLCRKCYLEVLCHTCYKKRADSEIASASSVGHTYLEYGGEEWWNLPKGSVSAAGQTIDTWLASVKAQYMPTLDP